MAQNFAILRTQKLKDPGAVRRSLKHAFRAQATPNADPRRAEANSHIGASGVDEAIAKFDALIERASAVTKSKRIRKNAVQCVEYLVAGSPEWFDQADRKAQDAYFRDALKWLRERHGAENVFYAGVHRDESTPHMYAYVCPRDPEDGRLNCRRFLGGAGALTAMQTDFAERVGAPHGLRRGLEKSRAKHKSVKRWYAEQAQGERLRPPKLPEPSAAPSVWERVQAVFSSKKAQDLLDQQRKPLEGVLKRMTVYTAKQRRLTQHANREREAQLARVAEYEAAGGVEAFDEARSAQQTARSAIGEAQQLSSSLEAERRRLEAAAERERERRLAVEKQLEELKRERLLELRRKQGPGTGPGL